MRNVIKMGCILFVFLLAGCKEDEVKTVKREGPKRIEPKSFTYSKVPTKSWLETNPNEKELDIVLAVNRMDLANLKKKDSLLLPSDLSGDLEYYLPFPFEIKVLENVKKILFFSYASQTFAAYEYGFLTHVGPTNMGKKSAITPEGLYFANWKAEETISTVDDEWKLKWNFNVENKEGIGFHEYELPGYPASHSCMRLLEKDAKMLYEFTDQWVLENATTVKIKGTPVVVFGTYNFDDPKPWEALLKDKKSLKISENDIENVLKPYLFKIKKEEEIRDNYNNTLKKQ